MGRLIASLAHRYVKRRKVESNEGHMITMLDRAEVSCSASIVYTHLGGRLQKIRRGKRSFWSYSFIRSIPVWTGEGGGGGCGSDRKPDFVFISCNTTHHVRVKQFSLSRGANFRNENETRLSNVSDLFSFPSWPAIIHFQLAPRFLRFVARSWERAFLL